MTPQPFPAISPDELIARHQTLQDAAHDLADARECEMALEDNRARVKVEAIARIMATDNALTGKAHSASSAADIVSTDDLYAQYLRDQRTSVVAVIKAKAAYESALRLCPFTTVTL